MQQGIKKLQWLEYLKVVFLKILNTLLCWVFKTRCVPATGWRAPGFLKLLLSGNVCVCVHACVRVWMFVCVWPRGYE